MKRVIAVATILLLIGSVLPSKAGAGPPEQEKSRPPEWSVEEARQKLGITPIGGTKSVGGSGQQQMTAIDRLVELGTEEAVDVLREVLKDELSHCYLKRKSIFALGKIGTEYAIKAIDEFELLGESRRTEFSTFRLGIYLRTTSEWASIPINPDFYTQDNEGNTWALFQWSRYGPRLDCPLDKPFSGPAKTAAPAPPCSPGDGIDHFCIQKSDKGYEWRLGYASGSLSDSIKDSDGDGLPDLEEKTLGTDPEKADSDSDGKPDGADPCPLTPAPKHIDEDAAIRQAVFTAIYATRSDRKVIYMSEGAPSASDEYRGYIGFILPTKDLKMGFYNLKIDVKSRTPNTAEVKLIARWEFDEAVGSTVTVEKKHGKWVAADIRCDFVA